MRIYQGTMVNGDVVHDGWVWIEWLYPGQNKISSMKELLAIEARIKEEKLKGWIASSEQEHTTMHKILRRMGATRYGQDAHALHFMKEVA